MGHTHVPLGLGLAMGGRNDAWGDSAPPPKDQSWGLDSIALGLGPGIPESGRYEQMGLNPQLKALPARSSSRGRLAPTSATIGGRYPRPDII